MSNLRTAAQQALEALESLFTLQADDARPKRCGDAITVLRAALAEPVQEPVVWMLKADIEHPSGWRTVFLHTSAMPTKDSVPLYTAPPQRKPLTEEEIDLIAQQGFHAK